MASQLWTAQYSEEEKGHTSEIYSLATRSYRCIKRNVRQIRAYSSERYRKQVSSENMSLVPLTERRVSDFSKSSTRTPHTRSLLQYPLSYDALLSTALSRVFSRHRTKVVLAYRATNRRTENRGQPEGRARPKET